MTRLVLVHGRIRHEERLLLQAADRLGAAVDPVDDRHLVLDPEMGLDADGVLVRSLSATRSLQVARACQSHGLPATNGAETIATCMDKAATSWALQRAGVPTPRSLVAFDPESALQALERIGYPAVLKPVQGSWARLVARVETPDQAAQILEHRAQLPNPTQHVYYVQEYVDTNHRLDEAGRPVHRDLRAFVVGDETVAAVWRQGTHWITNTARGATTTDCPVTEELDDLCQRAAAAVGGGVLAVDLMETPDGLTVHEVNHSMEFRNSIGPTGVDIPARILEHIVQEARR